MNSVSVMAASSGLRRLACVLLASGMIFSCACHATEGETEAGNSVVCDASGHLQFIKKADGGFVEYFYHPTLNKISAVVSDEVSTVFSYDKSGNLIRAYNTRDQLITLDYDRRHKVRRMVESNRTEHTRQELIMRYNSAGKPVYIGLVGKGEIRVRYDRDGEIISAKSGQGSAIAADVNRAFQVLMKVVSVAGSD